MFGSFKEEKEKEGTNGSEASDLFYTVFVLSGRRDFLLGQPMGVPKQPAMFQKDREQRTDIDIKKSPN